MNNLAQRIDRIVLGTVQLGIDYGVGNLSGKPTRREALNILDVAWESGIRLFDTAPSYGSEELLGEFIRSNGVQKEIRILTKIPSLTASAIKLNEVNRNLEMSLETLSSGVETLFFHDPEDASWLLKDPDYFHALLNAYPVSFLGVSAYEPRQISELQKTRFKLAVQFPLNILDRRFEQVFLPSGKRYARSILLQGLLASTGSLRPGTPLQLLTLRREYLDRLDSVGLDSLTAALTYIHWNQNVDHFLIGVDSDEQLRDILGRPLYEGTALQSAEFDNLSIDRHWFDPRQWN